MKRKTESNPGKYKVGGKLIQDSVGIRVVLYFDEDIKIVDSVLRKKFKIDEKSSTIDLLENTVFSVNRYNLIFEIPDNFLFDMPDPTNDMPIDHTFEIQIRTILSEGWHEVEHDLRYKRKEDWIGYDDLSRGFNGVLATLETAEWSMRKIFDDLAYNHYKKQNWDALLNFVLKMRISSRLSENLISFFSNNPDAARKLIRMNREKIFMALYNMTQKIPLTADNIIFVWNRIYLKNEDINLMAPTVISEIMNASNLH